MAALKPAFSRDGTITAANASQLSDGAAALLIAGQDAADKAGLRPKAIIRAMAVAADNPILQFTAVIPAARRAPRGRRPIDLRHRPDRGQRGVCAGARDLRPRIRHRLREAQRQRRLYRDRPPVGLTGARMMTDLVYELHRSNSRYGL